jgi:arginase
VSTVLCVPQWQGSSSPFAPRLKSGARIAAGLVPGDARVEVPVTDSDGAKVDGVRRLDALLENLRATRAALVAIDDVVVTVGGDCGVELAPIAACRARHGAELTVLWIDANPDVSTPVTLPSGSFHGMVLRTLLGEGVAALVPEEPLTADQIVLTGIREFEPGQREFLGEARIRWHGVDDFERALYGLAGPVYLHIDLDVLDPSEFTSVCYSYPNGPSVQRLLDLIARVDHLVGASITEHAPPDDAADTDVLRRIAEAVGAAARLCSLWGA